MKADPRELEQQERRMDQSWFSTVHFVFSFGMFHVSKTRSSDAEPPAFVLNNNPSFIEIHRLNGTDHHERFAWRPSN